MPPRKKKPTKTPPETVSLEAAMDEQAVPFIRRWVPELAPVPDSDLLWPWEFVQAGNVELDYPASLTIPLAAIPGSIASSAFVTVDFC